MLTGDAQKGMLAFVPDAGLIEDPVAFPKVLQAALRLPVFSYSLREAQGDP